MRPRASTGPHGSGGWATLTVAGALGDGQVAELRRIDNRVHVLLFDGNDESWMVIS